MNISPLDLTNVISEVIENLSMMAVEPPTEDEGFNPTLEGWIDFTGPSSGNLTIRCTDGFTQALAANLLGAEQTELRTQTNAWDALAELLNVVCGNLVTALFDSERTFTLSTPQVRIIESDNPLKVDMETTANSLPTLRLMIDEQLVEFDLRINNSL